MRIPRYALFLSKHIILPRVFVPIAAASISMAQRAPIAFRFGSVRLLQDAPLGTGAYGQVCKAVLGELPCAAKLLHPILVDPNRPRNRELFEQECRFLSEIRHPNIVQYLGLAQDPTADLPILLMELMDDSLTHFLELSEVPLPYHVQVNINYDIAQALTFLHTNQIVHRDLSSNNVLLIGDGVRAKVADFGMSKLNPGMSTLTMCPGTRAYMSPEALLDPPTYSVKLDCFQAGVLMVQIITRKFPDPSDATRRVRDARSPTGWVSMPVLEIERRRNHLCLVTNSHPMYSLAVDCLKDVDTQRPSAQMICHRLSSLKEAPQYAESHTSREREREGEIQERDQLIQQLRLENEVRARENRDKEEEKQMMSRRLDLMRDQIQQTLERRRLVESELRDEIHTLRESVTSKTRLIEEKDQLLQEKEKEKDNVSRENNILQLDLQKKEQKKDELYQEKARVLQENFELQQNLQVKDDLLQEKDSLIRQLQQSLQCASNTCQVSGPGLHSATANHPTYVLVELSDSSGRPCLLRQNVTAELELISEATPTSTSVAQWLWHKKPEKHVAVVATSPSQYEVSYIAVSRGQHKLHVQVNSREISGSPFTMTVYPDPTQLHVGRPVRVVTDLNYPYGIAFNSRGEMIISEWSGHQLSIFDIRGQKIRTFGSRGDSPEQMIHPKCIAINDTDNIYVSSDHKLQKFTSSGELIKCVGQRGSKEGEFSGPRGVTLYDTQVYLCDCDNHRIQVFDLDLNFIRSIGSRGKGRGEFNAPYDVKFDSAGNMYVAEYGNRRVQVMDTSGHFIRAFGQEEKGKMGDPLGLHIGNKYVYVSDFIGDCIVVYETTGQFVTSFGRRGHKEGEFDRPYCITCCADGFIHVCDFLNKRVQIF